MRSLFATKLIPSALISIIRFLSIAMHKKAAQWQPNGQKASARRTRTRPQGIEIALIRYSRASGTKLEPFTPRPVPVPPPDDPTMDR
jgi:hypothetical protein